MNDFQLSRRAVLKGVGTAIALPWLESLAPRALQAAETSAAPKRLAFLYIPNGAHMQSWTPEAEGTGYELTELLKPLAPFKEQMNVLTGLTLDKARANGDGPGDHARSLAAFLTCCQARKTHGADIKAGISADQVAAQSEYGKQTKYSSLEVGADAGGQSGNCDSGYSCAYSSNISWRAEATPVAKETNPRLVFERLFVDHAQEAANLARAKKEKYRKSVLDLVRSDADRLQKKLGRNDQRKMDEYLTSVRELEQRIERVATAKPSDGRPDYAKPAGIPGDYKEHLRLLADMIVLAFQTDTTRVSTFVFANEGSNRSYKFIDVPEGHHDLSHHGNDSAKHDKIKKINLFHMEQFAYLLDKLNKVQEGERTLLDNSMIVYGSGIADGNAHNHDNLPVILAGKGGGTITAGRHLRYDKDTPIGNLYVSMLERIGVNVDKLGDSTGKLDNLA